jgi:hypothetical protein
MEEEPALESHGGEEERRGEENGDELQSHTGERKGYQWKGRWQADFGCGGWEAVASM